MRTLRSLFKPKATTITHFAIEGMTCSGCAARVGKAIRSLPGVASVNVDLDAGRAMVVHDTNTSLDQIRQAIIAGGYKAEEAK